MGVAELAKVIEVTPTAVRQRLSRLLAQGLIEREAIRAGRGRPKHRYRLTRKGLRVTGSNFTDLALALWKEIGAIDDLAVRRTLMMRVVKALAAGYSQQIEGRTTAERMESLRGLLAQRRVPFSVDTSGELPVLTAHACPYHELAEEDRGICSLERMLFSELLGKDIELSSCRLDGGGSCQFQPT
jgi:predicted ArsR family transcriptional regulator